jgi:hypothetical protein
MFLCRIAHRIRHERHVHLVELDIYVGVVGVRRAGLGGAPARVAATQVWSAEAAATQAWVCGLVTEHREGGDAVARHS